MKARRKSRPVSAWFAAYTMNWIWNASASLVSSFVVNGVMTIVSNHTRFHRMAASRSVSARATSGKTAQQVVLERLPVPVSHRREAAALRSTTAP
ncbi:hypothetical protein [Streptomyces sp. B21-083]|uniref:hypothetical protein n=1 Tax=Streptomyces sp. B21-083 TaxID=3039410 RepID=UPI002FF3A1A5